MLFLTLDRSSPCPCLAVFRDGACCLAHVWKPDPTRTPDWIPQMAALLDQAGIAPETIEAFYAGTGPGSFSGIRGGIAALQGLSLLGARPLRGISSTAALARRFALERGLTRVNVVGDARRGVLWVAAYRIDLADGTIVRADGSALTHDAADFALLPPERLAETFADHPYGISPEWDRLRPVLETRLPLDSFESAAILPGAEDLGRFVLAHSQAALDAPIPVYLHPAV